MDDELFDRLSRRLHAAPRLKVTGVVQAARGLTVLATLPGARIGDLVRITPRGREPVQAEVIGFEQKLAVLMPLGRTEGIGAGDGAERCEKPFAVPCSQELVGRIVDGLGAPIDGGPPPLRVEWRDAHAAAPPPLTRIRIRSPMAVGVKAIDGLVTIGQGQRIGLFAGSGVGKSTIIGQIARSVGAEVTVIGLIGERGREVREFIEDSLGPEGLARSVVVCATSDTTPMERYKAGLTATTIAEWFRERGRRVLLLVDSITRLARALREIGLAAGEAPARRGFPPSVFALLPRLLERAGNSAAGVMTAVYAILTEAGDMDEPIADEVRGILDGHIVLERRIAERGLWPALDPLQSVSRVMDQVVTPDHREAARWLRGVAAVYEQNRDLIQMGAYRKGSDPAIDRAIAAQPLVEELLRQGKEESVPYEKTVALLTGLWRRETGVA